MSKWEYICFDMECNSLNPNRIWVICMTCLISFEKRTFVGIDQISEAIAILANAKVLVGHNIKGYDCKVIEKLTEGLIKFEYSKLLDTLEMSRAFADLPNHKLETWGELLGLEKMPQPSFDAFSPAMVPYCERDVELNVLVFLTLIELLIEKHGTFVPKRWQLVENYQSEKTKRLQVV